MAMGGVSSCPSFPSYHILLGTRLGRILKFLQSFVSRGSGFYRAVGDLERWKWNRLEKEFPQRQETQVDSKGPER